MSIIPFDALDQLASRQAGTLATWQLRVLGLGRSDRRYLPQRLGWTQLHRGVWRVLAAEASERQAIWAALLALATPPRQPSPTWEEAHMAARSGPAVTGLSAAFVRGLSDSAPSQPQLLIPHSTRREVPGLTVVRTRFEPLDRVLVQGLPVAPPLRMFWDLAWLARQERDMVMPLVKWMSRADGLRIMQAKDLHEVLRDPAAFRLPARIPSSFRLAVLRLATGHSHSGSEHRGRQIIREIAGDFGLTVHPRPLPLPDEFAPFAEADVAIPTIRFNAEIDGPHHDDPEQVERDARRDGRMRTELDWTVRRYSTRLVNDQEQRFRTMARADIAQAARAAGVPIGQRPAA